MLAIISFLAVIVIVVAVHEYGHYLAARWLGVRVLRFSVGFGSPLFMRSDKHGTEWVLAPIPFGGYVRMLDKLTAEQDNYPLQECIDTQSHLRRIIIYAAGPLANLLLSFVVIFSLLAGGEQGIKPQIDSIKPYSAAAAAGLAAGDEITAINDNKVALWQHAEIAIGDAIIGGEDIHIATAAGTSRRIAAGALGIKDIENQRGATAALGIYPNQRFIQLKVAVVAKDSAAAAAGIQLDDEMVMMNGVVLEHWHEAVDIITRHPNIAMPLVLWRDKQAITVTVTPASVTRGGKTSGYLGIAPSIDSEQLAQAIVTVSYSLPGLVAAAGRQAAGDISRAITFLRLVFTGGIGSENISGPIGIAAQSGEVAALGIAAWLRFIALISTSLGIINLLPLPALDGGQILLSVVQWITKRELSDSKLKLLHIFSAVVIILLTLFVIINDIINLL